MVAVGVAMLLAAWAATAHANGFRNPPEGANALGRAGGKIATINDASAVAHNPANLMDLTNSAIQVALTPLHSETTFRGPMGLTQKTDNPWAFLPNAFAVWPAGEDVALGLGLTTPFGQSTEWPQDSFFRYLSPYFAEVQLVNVNPVAAARLGKAVYVALGLDIYASDFNLKQFLPWSLMMGVPGLPDGRAEFSGDGSGIGLNAALTWKVTEAHRLALTFRSPVYVKYEGDFRIAPLPPPVQALGVQGRTDFETRIDYPASIGLGYGWEVRPGLRLGIDVEWINFSSFDRLPLDIGFNNPLLPARSVSQEWNDAWTCGFGVEWQVSATWCLRGGYVFLESPIPDKTLAPTLPDTDTHVLTLGVGGTFGRHTVDIAAALNLYEDRTISNNVNPAYNGTYETEALMFSVAYTFSF